MDEINLLSGAILSLRGCVNPSLPARFSRNLMEINMHLRVYLFSAEINFFHGFAGTGFLERISVAIPAEKTKKLITKNRLDQRSRHFRDSVY